MCVYIYIYIYIYMYTYPPEEKLFNGTVPYGTRRLCFLKSQIDRDNDTLRVSLEAWRVRARVTPGLHKKIPAYKVFARGWVAQEPICS